MTASFLGRNIVMGTTEKKPKDWKFYTQLGVLLSGIAGGLQANSNVNERVIKLEIQQQNQTETLKSLKQDQIDAMKEFKQELKDLREELKKLREEMAAKKIVQTVADGSSAIASQEFAKSE